MRVGLTLYGDLDTRSGGFHYDRKLVEGLRRAGDTVEVLELPWRSYVRGLVDGVDPCFPEQLRADVDVMLQDELAHPSLVGVNRRLPYPVVSVVHHLRASEPRRLSPLYRRIEGQYLSTVAGAVCNSTVTREAVTRLGVDPTATVVAPPAGDRFDPDDPAPPTRADGEPLRVVFVGNVTPRKGLDTLVAGMAAADATVDLTVVGRLLDADHVASVRSAVDRSGLDGCVRFRGELSDEELGAVFRSSHALAVPSRYEGFGIVYLEAMSFGLPVVASQAGGATDLVTDGETGLSVPPDDPAAVAAALETLADDERRIRMGQAARERYERHPDWAETTARVRGLLADVAEVGA